MRHVGVSEIGRHISDKVSGDQATSRTPERRAVGIEHIGHGRRRGDASELTEGVFGPEAQGLHDLPAESAHARTTTKGVRRAAWSQWEAHPTSVFRQKRAPLPEKVVA